MINPVPSSGSRSSASLAPMVFDRYVLRSGETFELLADRFGLEGAEREEFRRLNPQFADGNGIPGQFILVPRRLNAVPPPARASDGPPSTSPPSPSVPASKTLATEWKAGYNRGISRQNEYNAEIERALTKWPTLDPLVLKSLLAQESSFREKVWNKYGYAGIGQLGVREARSQGLDTRQSRMRRGRAIPARVDSRDERLQASRAIPAAAGLLRQKARTLNNGITYQGARLEGFNTLGFPKGDDYWRFVTATYNGGEGTILLALKFAYGDQPPAEVKWSDLVEGPGGDVTKSPLYRATSRVFGRLGASKYREISDYAREVLLRARQ